MEYFITLISSIVTNTIIYMILMDFFKTKYTPKINKNILYIVTICMVIGSVIINSFHIPNLNLLYSILTFTILNTMIFSVHHYKNILINISFFIIILILDAGVYILVNNLIVFNQNEIIVDIKSIINALLEFIIYNIFKNFLVKKNTSSLKTIETVSYILISIISFIMIWLAIFFIRDASPSLSVFFFAFTIFLILLNIYILKIMDTVSKTHELEEQISLIEKESELMLNHYQNLEETEKQTKFILHDIKNHLSTLENSMDYQTSHEYFDNIKSEIKKLYSSQYTERKILNILFNEKIRQADKMNIVIKIHNTDPDLTFINDFDIVTIFSNLLDNAIEAVTELPDTERKIDLYVRKIKNFIVIRTSNPCLNKINKENDKIISSKKNHKGLGLMSIENTIQKYDGNMVVEINENMYFTNTIMIRLPKK